MKRGVPLLLYVPKKYLKKSKINNQLFGSHKDIFPTLFNLALSKAEYVKSGNNLLDLNITAEKCYATNDYNVAFNHTGCVTLFEKPLYYVWDKKNVKHLIPANELETKQLDSLKLKAKANIASMIYNIQMQLSKK